MYAAHAQRQLTEQTTVLEERLTGLLRSLPGLVDELEDDPRAGPDRARRA